MLEKTVNSQNVNRITNLLAITPNVDSTLAGDIDEAVTTVTPSVDESDAMNMVDEKATPFVDESAMNMVDESTSRSILSPTEQAIEDARKRKQVNIDTLSPTEKALEAARNKEKIITDPSDTSQMLEPPQRFENTAGQMQSLQFEKDSLPGLTQIQSGIASAREALAPTETGSSQLYQDLSSGLGNQLNRASEIYQNLTDGLFSTFESQNPMGDNEFKASTSISDLGTGELPKASDIESYLSSVSDDKPKKDTSAKDRRDRRKRQKNMRKAASKALDTFSRKEYETVKDIDDSKRLSNAFKNSKAVKEKLKQQEKGIITGFAKGGLASRKKK
jgi:hypothetical protein